MRFLERRRFFEAVDSHKVEYNDKEHITYITA